MTFATVPGHLLSRVARQVPYLHPGNSWVLGEKYEGTGARQTTHSVLSATHFYTEFTAVGRDACSMVAFPA